MKIKKIAFFERSEHDRSIIFYFEDCIGVLYEDKQTRKFRTLRRRQVTINQIKDLFHMNKAMINVLELGGLTSLYFYLSETMGIKAEND